MGPLAIIAAAGGIMGAAGNIIEGQAAYKAGKLNAGVLRLKAAEIRKKTVEDERQTMVNARKAVGEMKANYGASGVTMEGSPLDILEESIAAANRDSFNIRYAGEMEARSAEFDANLAEMQGKAARTSSYFGAFSSLAGGATKAGEYSKLSRGGGPSLSSAQIDGRAAEASYVFPK